MTTYETTTSAMGTPQTFTNSFNRYVGQTQFLARYSSPTVQLNGTRSRRRPWDTPAIQLNELGPAGYNYFNRVSQPDEQRRHHAEWIAQSLRSPALRAKEALNVHHGSQHRLPKPDPLASWSKPAIAERPSTSPSFSYRSEPVPAFAECGMPTPTALRMTRPTMAELMHGQ